MNWTPPEGTVLHHAAWFMIGLPAYITQDRYGSNIGLYPWPSMPEIDDDTICIWHIKPKPCSTTQ